ncbi:GNAT family N-acetyltransferase, partial [Streptomyces sp. SID685]
LNLRVLGHNTPARKLYEAEGFAVEGVSPEEFFLDGAYVDDISMGRAL